MRVGPPPPPGTLVGVPAGQPVRRSPWWLPLAVAILVLALLGVGILLLTQRTGGSGTGPNTGPSTGSSTTPSATPSTGSTATPSATPSTGQGSTSSASAPITLDKNDYIGGDVNEVADRLRALQLVPVIRAAPLRVGRPGEVVDLVWQGQLEPGSEIIVIAIPQGRGKNR